MSGLAFRHSLRLPLHYPEFAAHRRIVQSQMRGDLVQSISVFAVRLENGCVPIPGKELIQPRPDRSALSSRDLFDLLVLGHVLFDELLAPEIDLSSGQTAPVASRCSKTAALAPTRRWPGNCSISKKAGRFGFSREAD